MRAFGTFHSWNDIADTDGTHISTANFKDITIDVEKRSVTFGAGVTYSMLVEALKTEKMAIENLPAMPNINVVGSVMTGASGSGIHNTPMSGYATAIAFVDPRGYPVRLRNDQDSEEF